MSTDMFPDAAIDYIIHHVETVTDQIWFITDYDSTWAIDGLVEDVEKTAAAYPNYIFFYGPLYTPANWAAIQSDSRRPGMLFPPTHLDDREQSGTGVETFDLVVSGSTGNAMELLGIGVGTPSEGIGEPFGIDTGQLSAGVETQI